MISFFYGAVIRLKTAENGLKIAQSSYLTSYRPRLASILFRITVRWFKSTPKIKSQKLGTLKIASKSKFLINWFWLCNQLASVTQVLANTNEINIAFRRINQQKLATKIWFFNRISVENETLPVELDESFDDRQTSFGRSNMSTSSSLTVANVDQVWLWTQEQLDDLWKVLLGRQMQRSLFFLKFEENAN